jgi:hypothetical protein
MLVCDIVVPSAMESRIGVEVTTGGCTDVCCGSEVGSKVNGTSMDVEGVRGLREPSFFCLKEKKPPGLLAVSAGLTVVPELICILQMAIS